jgi:hypothetical protein
MMLFIVNRLLLASTFRRFDLRLELHLLAC